MAVFTVNGVQVTPSKNQKLLRFLRDALHLTSVKDGCSQGACGACTVIIDGETCKACVPDTDSLMGKSVITVEGLAEREKEVYTFAYAEAGAVQCGFCIPGMVMCTKALLDKNPAPSKEEIRYALRNNYCRCTGYVKIIAAVKLAAQIRKTGVIPEKGETSWAAVSSGWTPEKGARNRPVSRRLLYGRNADRQPAPKQIPQGEGSLHRHRKGKGSARRGRRLNGGGRTGKKYYRPSAPGPVCVRSRRTADPLSGRRHCPGSR